MNREQEVQAAAQQGELQIIQAKNMAQFALTPIGQQWKQFEIQQRMAQMYSTSTIVPETYRGNLGNCVIAIDMAMRMNANPLMVIQNLYIVHGNPSFSSKFLIATINASGRFTPLRYEFKGKEGTDQYGCRVYAYESQDKEHKEPLYGDWVTLDMAKKEGWFNKSGSKWQTMPSQMLRYRAAAFWQRVYCPEISMGLMTAEEAEDIDDQTPVNINTSVKQEIASEANKEMLQAEQDEPSSPQKQPLGVSEDIPEFMRG